ncbi:MAG TPA: MFS transporter [Mycobacteriales bacterium]|nr:MFS transporter [Mycobacteriales bacterium]
MSPGVRRLAHRAAGEGAAALRRPDFRALLIAHAVSVAGYWLFLTTALTQLSDGGTAESSRLTALLTLPLVVLSPFTGLAVDRLGPRRTLLTAYAAGAVVLVGISTTDSVAGLYAGAIALSAVIALLRPSVFGLLSRTVDPRHIGPANGLLAAAGEASIMLGPLAAYALISAGGSRPSFLAGAGAYTAGALLLLRVANPEPLAREAVVGWRGRVGEVLAGARSLRSDPTIRLTSACLITLFGFIGALFTLEPNFLSDEVGVAKGSLGVAYAAAGLGSCVSALLVARRPARARPVPAIGTALAMVGAATIAYSTSRSLPEVAFWNLVVGLCFGQTLPPAFSVIQRRTPSGVIGRAMAAISIVQQAALGIVALLVGQVLPGSVRVRVLGTGVVLVVVGIAVFLTTRLRDDPPAPAGSPDAGGSTLPAEQVPPVELAPAP